MFTAPSANLPASPLRYAHVLFSVDLLKSLASAKMGGLVGAGAAPSIGMTPTVGYAGVHLRSISFAFHLKLPASTKVEQPTAAKPRTYFIVETRKTMRGLKARAAAESKHTRCLL